MKLIYGILPSNRQQLTIRIPLLGFLSSLPTCAFPSQTSTFKTSTSLFIHMEEQKSLLMDDPAPGQAAQVPIPTSKSVDDVIKHDGDWTLHLSKQRDSIFFKLPVEIRLLIYRELLASAFQVSSLLDQLTLKSQGIRYARKVLSARKVVLRRYLPSCFKLHPEILRTCRAIFAEAIPILYREKAVTIFARSGPKEKAPKFSVDGIEPDEISHLQPILRYAHHLRVIIVNILFHGRRLEDDFRHKVDCIFLFLQKVPQIDCCLCDLVSAALASTPQDRNR
ncbi:hypothetical protein V8F33_007824 [Rhypophila sp. PSN 637]